MTTPRVLEIGPMWSVWPGKSAYWVADAFANHRFTPQRTGQLNISNLFDRRHYEFGTGYVWGEPRRFAVRLDYRF